MKKILIISLAVNLALIIFAGYLLWNLGVWKATAQLTTITAQTTQNTQNIQAIIDFINQSVQAQKK